MLTFSNIFTVEIDSGGMWVHRGKGIYRKNKREREREQRFLDN